MHHLQYIMSSKQAVITTYRNVLQSVSRTTKQQQQQQQQQQLTNS